MILYWFGNSIICTCKGSLMSVFKCYECVLKADMVATVQLYIVNICALVSSYFNNIFDMLLLAGQKRFTHTIIQRKKSPLTLRFSRYKKYTYRLTLSLVQTGLLLSGWTQCSRETTATDPLMMLMSINGSISF